MNDEIENGKIENIVVGGKKKRKKNSDEGRREKGEKPQGYLPTLEAKVKIILKRREKREKKRENEPISNLDLKRKYVLMKKNKKEEKGRKERRRR